MVALEENMVVADRFRLVRMVGRGGMGSVWQAMHLGLDTPCAVKFIEGELANVAEAHARFAREAKAAAQLRSPNVVQIFDHGVWEGHPYIAMELLEGEDLGKRLIHSGGRLPAADVNFVVEQVCRALSRAHQAGVVHRDLKPDNIFVVKDDDRDIVKILDFGVAKSALQSIDGSNTKTGAMLGTPYYMSPEQAQGIKSVDARSDLWSLAVIVFQCLTGRLPFESEALGDLLVKIIVAPIPTPSQYNPGVPPGVDAWWSRAADRNPDNRYQTAKEFAEKLNLALVPTASLSESSPRGRMHRGSERPGGATAMMTPSRGGDGLSPFPMTSQPAGVDTAAMTTPHGFGGQAGAGAGAGVAPRDAASVGPPMPYVAPTSSLQGTTANPVAATFSGVGLHGLPRKSAPVVFLFIGLLALVGLGLGGFAMVKRYQAETALTERRAASPPGVPTAPQASVTVAASSMGSPSESAELSPKASAAAPSSLVAAPPPQNTPGDRRPTAAPLRSGGSLGLLKPQPTPLGVTAVASSPPPTKPVPKEKPINLGF